MNRRTLLIFGAGGNLGTEVTEILLESRYDEYYLFDNHPEKIKAEKENIHIIGTKDLSKEENVKMAFDTININSKSFYFLFSTIGGYSGGSYINETDFDDWKKMQILNLDVSFLIAKYFTRLVKKSAGGSICFTSALTSFNAAIGKAAYGVTKSGLNYLIETLSEEGKINKYSANGIAPSIIDTKTNRIWVENEADLISSEEIGKVVNSIFEHFKIVSGNIFKLPFTLKLQ